MPVKNVQLYYWTSLITGGAIINSVKAAINEGTSWGVSNSSMGGDPSNGNRKVAVVIYEMDDGNVMTKAVQEGGAFDFSSPGLIIN